MKQYQPATDVAAIRRAYGQFLSEGRVPRRRISLRNVRVTRGDELVLSADVDFSISENPAFRFTLRPGQGGALRARVTDSNEQVFESSAP